MHICTSDNLEQLIRCLSRNPVWIMRTANLNLSGGVDGFDVQLYRHHLYKLIVKAIN